MTKLSSPSEIKTASAYILFYTKRSSSSSINSQAVTIPQTPHWCRPLIKKHHKIPSLSNSSSVNGDSLTDKDVTNDKSKSPPENSTNGDNSPYEEPKKLTNGHDFTTKDASQDKTSSENQNLTNGYHNSSTSKSSNSCNGSSSAPLARMEDIGIGMGYAKELQIESTV